MKNTASIISTYRLARYALAAGTGLTAWITWRSFSEGYFGPGIVSAMTTIILSVVTLLIFDGVAFSSLESAVKHIFKQERMPTRSALFYVISIGMFAYAGSMIFSLRAVPVLADAAVEDKSETYKDMQQAKAQGDASRAALLQEANKEIARAERALTDAKAAQKTAQADGVKAQGGEFARLWLSGNTWVRSAPAFKRQRAAVATYEANATQAVQDAAAALKRAQEAKTGLLSGSDAETAQIIAAGSAAVQTWQGRLTMGRSVLFWITVFSGLLSILLLLNLGSLRAIPDTKDLIDVLRESFDLGMDAIIHAFSGVNEWARAKGKIGVVFGGQSVPTKGGQSGVSVEQVVPPSGGENPEGAKRVQKAVKLSPRGENYKGSQRDKLRRKIARYKRLAAADQLGEKGRKTLEQMQSDYAKMKGTRS